MCDLKAEDTLARVSVVAGPLSQSLGDEPNQSWVSLRLKVFPVLFSMRKAALIGTCRWDMHLTIFLKVLKSYLEPLSFPP